MNDHKSKYWAATALHGELGELLGIEGPAPQQAVRGFRLDIPYHSQWERDAELTRRDCGPACVEMVGEYLCLDTDVTTNDIMWSITGGEDRGTRINELQESAMAWYSVTLDRYNEFTWDELVARALAGEPCIVLVHYGSFPTRIDRNYTQGHYMVVCGFDEVDYQGKAVERVILHDPDFYGDAMEMGAFIPVVKSVFMKMWDDCHMDRNPRRMALVASI